VLRRPHNFLLNLRSYLEQHLVAHAEFQQSSLLIGIFEHLFPCLKKAILGLLKQFLPLHRKPVRRWTLPTRYLHCNLGRSLGLCSQNQLKQTCFRCRGFLKIIAKLRTIQQLQPVSLHRYHVVSQIFLQQSIYPFRLSIGLRMVGSQKFKPCSHHIEQRCP